MSVLILRSSSGGPPTLTHNASFSVTGSGFATKSTPGPTLRDDCMHGQSIDTRWDGAVPNAGTPSSINLAYASDTFSVGFPHARVNKYLTGSHGGQNLTYSGNNVGMWIDRTFGSFPGDFYVSWYTCMSPSWSFGADFNYKFFAYNGATGGPYELPNNWYLSNAFPPSIDQYRILDDAAGLALSPTATDDDGPIVELDDLGTWFKYEVEARLSQTSSGFIRTYVNNVLRQSYSGRTDNYPGTGRSFLIGGYHGATPNNPDNRRFFADIYLDFSMQRLVLMDNDDPALATIVEPQIATAWADGSITANANLGAFTSGQTVYPKVRTTSSTWVSALQTFKVA